MKAIYYSVMSPRILTSIGTTNAYLIGFVSYARGREEERRVWGERKRKRMRWLRAEEDVGVGKLEEEKRLFFHKVHPITARSSTSWPIKRCLTQMIHIFLNQILYPVRIISLTRKVALLPRSSRSPHCDKCQKVQWLKICCTNLIKLFTYMYTCIDITCADNLDAVTFRIVLCAHAHCFVMMFLKRYC